MHNHILDQKELLSDRSYERNLFKLNSVEKIAPYLPDELLNTMNFKLKTQLSNIGLASDLLETTLLSTEQQMFVAIIQRSTDCLKDLITDINSTVLKYRLQPENSAQISFSNY